MSKYVSTTLYKEGIRRTRVMGIVMLLIFIIGNALPMITAVVQRQSGGLRGVEPVVPPVQVLTHMQIAPFLTMFIFLGPILFTMFLFSFLNKRRASDFYHAIPYTRKCVFVSFSLAIFTWLAVIIGASILINSLLAIIFPGYAVGLSAVIFGFFTFLLGAILVTSVMLLAKSISGTGLTNLVIGGMIVLYPTIIQTLFYGLLRTVTRILPFDDVISLRWNFNIPVRVLMDLDWYLSFQESFLERMVFPLIYTFVLSLFYFVLAGFLLHHRKSETAERGAPNKVLQHLFRCLLVFPLTLMMTGIIVVAVEEGGRERGVFEVLVMGIFFLLAFLIPIVYFTYELLSTRKPRNLIIAIPVFGFVILANVIFTGGLYIGREIIWRNTPSAEEIVGIREMPRRGWELESWVASRVGIYPSYNELLTRDLYIHNQRLHGYIADEIQATIGRARMREPDIVRYQDRPRERRFVTVSIKRANGRTTQRSVPLGLDQRTYLQVDAGLSDPIYLESLVKLPEFSANVNFQLNLEEEGPKLAVADAFDWQQLWAMYAREYQGLTKEQQLHHNGMHSKEQEDVFFTITFTGRIEDEWFTSVYQVTRQTPETLVFLLEVSSLYELRVQELFQLSLSPDEDTRLQLCMNTK